MSARQNPARRLADRLRATARPDMVPLPRDTAPLAAGPRVAYSPLMMRCAETALGGRASVAAQRFVTGWVFASILAVVLLACSHVPDGRTQRDVPQQSPGAEPSPGEPPSPGSGVLFGRVTSMLPPTASLGEGRVPGPIPGGSLAPVGAAHVGIAPVGGTRIWWVVTSVDGRFAIRVPPGTYQVTLEPYPGLGAAKGLPATVTVVAGQETRLDIHLDSGLR